MIPLGFLGGGAPTPSVTGGTITSDDTYYYHSFTTTSGELVVANIDLPVEYLLVGTGGAGGNGTGFFGQNGGWNFYTGSGGGGAGGVLTGSTTLVAGVYPITIGATRFSDEALVSDTTAFGLTAEGGGHGQMTGGVGANGGSGGGGAFGVNGNVEGFGTPGQGNDGGRTFSSNNSVPGGGGGGGAGAAGVANGGSAPWFQADGANGGAGVQVWGNWYAAGGGGFPSAKVDVTGANGFAQYYGQPGFGGTGGGGISATHGSDTATSPTTPGSGGGAGGNIKTPYQKGAMGVVRVRYLRSLI